MKIILIITNNIFYRNYINRFVLNGLNKISELKIIGNENVIDKKNKINFFFKENKMNKILHSIIAGIKMFSNQDKSKSFKYRIKRRYLPKKITVFKFKTVAKYFKKYLYYFFFKIFSFNKLIAFTTEKFLRLFLKENKLFIDYLIKHKPDLVLLPTNGFSSYGLDLEFTLNKSKIKYISLVDNWDNLSSKTILLYNASHYGVWGEQSRKHAKIIQNIDYKDTTSIGTPRFEYYRSAKIKKLFDFKYILFIGTTVEFDEAYALKKLNNILVKNEIDIKILYRPHPWRESLNFPDLSNLKKVVLDPQMLSQYKSKSRSEEFQPDLDDYASIISGSEFVIGGMTSMLIEAHILKKHFIGLAHSEPGNKLGPREMLEGYTHFDDVSSLKNITIIKNLLDLENVILEKLNNKKKFLDDDFFYYFIDYGNKTYSSKLIELIKKIKKNDK